MHYDAGFGWGYLVPAGQELSHLDKELDMQDPEKEEEDGEKKKFPVECVALLFVH